MSPSPSARARTRLDPTQRAAQIRAAARDVAREGGLNALTLRAVAQRAGVVPGLVSHYAVTMDDLVAGVFADIVGGELDDLRVLVAPLGGPMDRLACVFSTVLSSGHSDTTLVWVDAWSRSRHNAALTAAIDQQMSRWHSFVVDIIEAGRTVGDFATTDPDSVAWHVVALIDGLSVNTLARGTDPAPFVHRLALAAETLVGAPVGALTSRLRSTAR